MATEFITTDQTANYSIDVDDSVTLLEGVKIVSTGWGMFSTGLSDNNNDVNIFGTVLAGAYGLNLRGTDAAGAATGVGNHDVYIGQSGVVRSVGAFQTSIQMGGSGNTLINHGEVSGYYGVFQVGDGFSLSNTGLISGDRTAVDLSSSALSSISNSGSIQSNENGVGIRSNSSFILANTGTISAGSIGILSSQSEGHIVNSGSITGGAQGINTYLNADQFTNIDNSGMISGRNNGLNFGNAATSTVASAVNNSGEIYASGNAVNCVNGTDVDINNSGLISSNEDGIYYQLATGDVNNSGIIEGNEFGIQSNLSENNVSNSGSISGLYHGVYFSQATAAVSVMNSGDITGGIYGVNVWFGSFAGSVTNSGTIEGGSAAIYMNNQNSTVINSGTVYGDIDLGDGTNLFDGRGGLVVGQVEGGSGDDTYIVSDSDITLVENAAEGADLVKSTVSFRLGDNFENLTLLTHKNINGVGNNDANSLVGNAGDNRLQGQAGDDTLNGAWGDDKLLGSFGNDTLLGGKGGDILNGGTEND